MPVSRAGNLGTGSPYGHRYWPFRFWPVEALQFGGLNLLDQPDQLGPAQAMDLANVDFDQQGAIRTRDGTTLFATPPSATTVKRMRPFYRAAGDQLMSNYTTNSGGGVTVFSGQGAVVATHATSTANATVDFAPIGTPAASRCYVCDSGAVMQRWDGSAFTTVAGSPQCSYVAVNPDNRLIAANVSQLPTGSGAANPSTSLVHFSDPGAPETWSPNNYVYLTPGDGDDIMSIVRWRELVFVFKRFRYFVFYSVGTDSTGNPIFNYRTIESRSGVENQFGAVACPEGVYFASHDGIYITTGQEPKRISDQIRPFWTGGFSAYWTAGNLSSPLWGDGTDPGNVWGDGTNPANLWGGSNSAGDIRLACANGRLYAFLNAGTTVLVYDTIVKAWTVHEFPTAIFSMSAIQVNASGPEIVLYGNQASIGRVNTAVSTDQGTPINAHYRSGFYAPFGFTTVQVVIRETVLEGQGTPYFSVARDFAQTLPTSGGGAKAQVTLGTAPISGKGRHRVAQRGGRFSYQIEGVAPWRLDTLAHHVNMPRPPGIETSLSSGDA